MLIRNRAFEIFSDLIDEELKDLVRDNANLAAYNEGFEIPSRITFFNENVRKGLFFIVFNERLLAFLSRKIDQYFRPKYETDPMFFGKNIQLNESLSSISAEEETVQEMSLKGPEKRPQGIFAEKLD